MYLILYTAEGASAGNFRIQFASPPNYMIGGCSYRTTNSFPSSLPAEVNMLWQITKLPGPRLTVQYNGVTLLDVLMSNDTCGSSVWSTVWTRQVKQIRFDSWDKVSEEYWGILPGNPLTIFNITCLTSYYYYNCCYCYCYCNRSTASYRLLPTHANSGEMCSP